MSEIKGTNDNFDQEVVKSDLPVLVDFWAEWCGPCKVIGPIISELAQKHEGKLKVVKVDVDQNPELVQKYGIQSIPTMKFFKDGQDVGEIIGAAPQGMIEAKLATIL